VVTDGLEDSNQLQALRVLDCPLGRRYRFCRPLAAGDAVALLLTGQNPATAGIPMPARSTARVADHTQAAPVDSARSWVCRVAQATAPRRYR